MCGIAASYAYDSRAQALGAESVLRMCDRMRSRGPDGDGLWRSADGRAVLGHRRLAIIDLSAGGAQPMSSKDASLALTFNGEIYNYRELRRELEAKGYQFRTQSDTEVLLQLYADRGDEMVHALRGMFAFALWDGRTNRLLLARDPFGIKPLYYADDGRCIFVASEVKALLAAGVSGAEPEAAGHTGFFLWGHVPEPFTLYKRIRALPAGSLLAIDRSGASAVREYANLRTLLGEAEDEPARVLHPTEAAEELRSLLLDSVKHHLVADVDVGVFLSAGRDSTTLAALATELGGQVASVTLGFSEYRNTSNDEVPLAEMVAKHYATSHQTIWVTRDDFRRELPRFLDRMDQPSIDGVNSYFVARAAAQTGLKVALSGLGGDEIFGGYSSFHEVPRLQHFVGLVPNAKPVGRAIRRAVAPFAGAITSPKYAGVVEYGSTLGGAYLLRRGLFLPWELQTVLPPEMAREGLGDLDIESRLADTSFGLRSDRFRISALEGSWYMRNQLLRDTDWASMTHSLEVRVPFVDWTLWKRLASLMRSAQVGKDSLARVPAVPLPQAVLDRPKTGFQVPTRQWMNDMEAAPKQRGLRGWAQFIYKTAA
ncbi:MAG: asparagine synthase (glutamine-hydrolyzing) [Gemmatimonadaceae bacterium]